jgi:hypothetical protein
MYAVSPETKFVAYVVRCTFFSSWVCPSCNCMLTWVELLGEVSSVWGGAFGWSEALRSPKGGAVRASGSSDHWYMPTRIVGWGPQLLEWTWLKERGYRLFSSEGVFVAALFGHFAIRIQTITGARLGEVQQIAQNPECIKQLVNVGPKATTRWLLRLIPKGEGTERRDY